MKKKALLSSVLTIALCLSLIAGSTFALFTSETKTNIAITSGTVNVTAQVTNLKTFSKGSEQPTGTFENGGTATLEGQKLTLDRMTPGDSVTADLVITNNSNVAIQYRTILRTVVDGQLLDVLNVQVGDATAQRNGRDIKSAWTTWDTAAETITVSVTIELPLDVGNEYQDLECELLYIVEAVQGNADMPDEWDGVTTEAPTVTGNTVEIENAAQLVYVMNATNMGVNNIYQNKTIVLDRDIDLGGATVTGFGAEATHWVGTFDGNGHTISNFSINRDGKTYYAGLFNYVYDGTAIKNVTVKNATVVGDAFVGAVAAAIYNGGIVENCHAINCTVAGEKKVGSVVGLNHNATVKDCSATNCAVYCEVSADTESSSIVPQAGKVVGFSIKDGNAYPEGVIGCTGENVTVTFEASYIWTDDATALANALKANKKAINITLTNDVSVNISLLNPQIGGSGEYRLGGTNTEQINIDLNGHKLTLDTTYMSALGANNTNAVINVKNGSMNSTNNSSTVWNIYDLIFANCTWNFEDITFDKAVSIYTGATATMKNVTINDNNDVYGLWITADAKIVTLDNVTINCPNGRAIAIKDQYRVSATNKVVLNISNSTIKSARKAAVLVSSNGGATVTASNVDISNVTEDQINIVWKDNGTSAENGFVYANADVSINGVQAIVEP